MIRKRKKQTQSLLTNIYVITGPSERLWRRLKLSYKLCLVYLSTSSSHWILPSDQDSSYLECLFVTHIW